MARPKQATLLIEGSTHWHLSSSEAEVRLCPVDCPASQVVSEAVARIKPTKAGSALAILLNATSVLHSSFPRSDTGGTKARAALEFRLEANLPLSAEEFVAAFQLDPKADGQVAAIATEKTRLLELISLLRSEGIELHGVFPGSLLVAQTLLDQKKIPTSAALVLARKHSSETLVICKQLVRSWRLENGIAEAERGTTVILKQLDLQLPQVIAGMPPDLEAVNRTAEIKHLEVDLDQLERDCARSMIAHNTAAWFDLLDAASLESGDANSASNWLTRLAGTAALCLLVIAGALFWRASETRRLTNELRQSQQEVFRRVFPDKRVPTAVLARLRSEHAKVTASRSTSSSELPLPAPALPIIQKLVEALPNDVPFSVQELRVENGDVYLDVEVQQHSEAGAITTALQSKGINFSPPTTELAGPKVRARLRGVASPPLREVISP